MSNVSNELREAIKAWSLQWTARKAVSVLNAADEIVSDKTLTYLLLKWHERHTKYDARCARIAEHILNGVYADDIDYAVESMSQEWVSDDINRLNETILDIFRDVYKLWQ